MAEHGIYPIEWPPYSPDLNLIETLWNKMKDWLGARYPEQKVSYDQPHKQVQEAWEAIDEEVLEGLLNSMPARCEAVIKAEGMYTKY